MEPSAFIDDGYTEHAVILEHPGLHPAYDFDFRPMTMGERAAYLRQTQNKSAEQCHGIAADFIVSHVSAWSLTQEGKPTKPKLLKLKPAIWNRIFAVLMGEAGHDGVSDGSDPEGDSKN